MPRPAPRTALAAALLGLAAACGLSGCASTGAPELLVGLDKGRMNDTLRSRYGGRLPIAAVPEAIRRSEESANETLLAIVRARLARLDGAEGATVSPEGDGLVRVRFPAGADPDAVARAAHALALRGDVGIDAIARPDDPYPERLFEDYAGRPSDPSLVPRGFRFVDDPEPPFAARRLVFSDGDPPAPSPGLHVPHGLPGGNWGWRFVPSRAPDGSLGFRPVRTFPAGRKDLIVSEVRCEPAEDRNGVWRVLARLDPECAREYGPEAVLRHASPDVRDITADADGNIRFAADFKPYAIPEAAVLTNGMARTLVISGFTQRRDAEFVAGLLSDGPLPAPVLVWRTGAQLAQRANPPQAP